MQNIFHLSIIFFVFKHSQIFPSDDILVYTTPKKKLLWWPSTIHLEIHELNSHKLFWDVKNEEKQENSDLSTKFLQKWNTH